MKKYFIPVLHLIIILAAFSSPFWLDWRFVVAGYFIYLLQNLIFNRCILFVAQFWNINESFYSHYLHKIGISWERKYINFVADYILPPAIILTALIYQEVI